MQKERRFFLGFSLNFLYLCHRFGFALTGDEKGIGWKSRTVPQL